MLCPDQGFYFSGDEDKQVILEMGLPFEVPEDVFIDGFYIPKGFACGRRNPLNSHPMLAGFAIVFIDGIKVYIHFSLQMFLRNKTSVKRGCRKADIFIPANSRGLCLDTEPLKPLLIVLRFAVGVVFNDPGFDHKDDPFGDVGGMVGDPLQIFTDDDQMYRPGDRLGVGYHVGKKFPEDLVV